MLSIYQVENSNFGGLFKLTIVHKKYKILHMLKKSNILSQTQNIVFI